MDVYGLGIEVTTPASAQVRHVRLFGELDLAGAPILTERLVEAAGSTVELDLAGLTFIDAAGVGSLVTARNRIEASRNHLSVFGATGHVKRVLEILELADFLRD